MDEPRSGPASSGLSPVSALELLLNRALSSDQALAFYADAWSDFNRLNSGDHFARTRELREIRQTGDHFARTDSDHFARTLTGDGGIAGGSGHPKRAHESECPSRVLAGQP
ncbi:MAG: hypothetical protein ACI9MC_001248 [Kiritimatiellia bacterium]|jgi:hypothetical protein